ncbi:uncharacterized protein [Pseudochaenichthys georgianus]|uniref:uncharacterized protein n=1 Tax=Pseudochaenichthys georgianus TaxID=52239 RepID=UPI0039C04875
MVINIYFYGDKAKQRDTGTNCRVIPMANGENKQQFLEMLSASGELPVGLSTFKAFADPFKPKPWYQHLSECSDDQGAVEVKCPLKWNSDLSADHWPADKRGHLDTLLSPRTNHSYYTQVQMQMFVCKTTYADFITWTPTQTVIFRVQQDEDFQCQAVDTISRVWARHIDPQLAGTTIPDTELELQESTDSVSDTEQELQNNYVVSTVIPGRRAEQ